MFTNGKFNTAEHKDKVYKQWVKFLESDCKVENFYKDLYKHLSLHFGFIAHYNQHGFYESRFSMDEFEEISHTFMSIINAQEYQLRDENTSNNEDLNRAMVAEAKKHWPRISEVSQSKDLAKLQAQRAALDDKIKTRLST